MDKISKYGILVQNILVKIGGSKNIKDVYNCATRMRVTLYNGDDVKINEIKAIDGIHGALWSNGELQIIIGQEVAQVTTVLKEKISLETKGNQTDFITKGIVKQNHISIGRRFLKSVSAIFGPLIPFLVGVGLIMALQQLLIRTTLVHDMGKVDQKHNTFDLILNIIASNGFKMMGIIAMWSTVRYLGGKQPTALALGLIMISPLIPVDSDGNATYKLIQLGSWEIKIEPLYSTILAFIAMGVIISYGQKWMEKYFNSLANFILNPLLTILLGGLIFFFIIGPIMGVLENAMLTAFDWFMNLPFGLGTLIVGLTWQPLVVLGIHNILFFAAVDDIVKNNNPSLFLAAAFAAAWAQMGAAICVGIKSKRLIDKSTAFAAVTPGVISGPTESCIYGVNLPRLIPFVTGVIAGGIGGWLIGMFGVKLDNLAGLGGIVGFLAYTHQLPMAIVIDLSSLLLGVLITFFFWQEDKKEKNLVIKSTNRFIKRMFLKGKNDYNAQCLIKIIKNRTKFKTIEAKITQIEQLTSDLVKFDGSLAEDVKKFVATLKNKNADKQLTANLITKLKMINSDRQLEAIAELKKMKANMKSLKELNVSTKKYAKIAIVKTNLEYKLKKINVIQEDKNATLFNKGQKLINSNSLEKVNRGNELIEHSKINGYKLEKVKLLSDKIAKQNELLTLAVEELRGAVDTHYQKLITDLENVEKVTNKRVEWIRNQYWNDLNYFEIKENTLQPRNIEIM